MTSVGPYATLDDVTWPDKKNADITLAPKVFLTTRTIYKDWRHDVNAERMQRDFTLTIGGWISYVMQEPLSAEKMWVKKIELEAKVVSGVEIYEAVPKKQGNYIVGYDQGKLLFNGRADAVADALKEYYPLIMQKAWVHLNTDEILNLKEKTKEIRAWRTNPAPARRPCCVPSPGSGTRSVRARHPPRERPLHPVEPQSEGIPLWPPWFEMLFGSVPSWRTPPPGRCCGRCA